MTYPVNFHHLWRTRAKDGGWIIGSGDHELAYTANGEFATWICEMGEVARQRDQKK